MPTWRSRNPRVGHSETLWILLFASVFSLAGAGARADTVNFNFSGSLSTELVGNTTVIGTFTVNTTNQTITASDFTTPDGPFNSSVSGFSGSLSTYTPAFSPADDFVNMVFFDPFGNALGLLFETNLATFSASGAALYTGLVEPTSFSATASGLGCLLPTGGATCGIVYGSTFAFGSATPVAPATAAEPGTLSLLALALLGGLWLGRKRIFVRS